MSTSVFVHRVASPFDPKRTTEIVPWHRGMTILDCCPQMLDGLTTSDIIATVDGERERDWMRTIRPGQHITFCPIPRAPAVPMVFSFAGAELFTLAISPTIAAAMTFAGNMALTMVVGKLLAPPKKSTASGQQDSQTYQFDGITNRRQEGTAIPVVYGMIRFGGVCINEYVTFDPYVEDSVYYGLFLMSHGPVKRIGGVGVDTEAGQWHSWISPLIELDRNSVRTFDDVKAQIRLGSLESEPCTAFHEIAGNHEGIDLALLNDESGSSSYGILSALILTNATYANTTVSNPVFDEYGEEWSMPAEFAAERAEVHIQFGRGLGIIDGSGNLINHAVSFLVRYIELDASGAPISSGGPESDGYVRLPPLPPIVARKQSSFVATLPVPLYDPVTYSHPIPGEAVLMGSAGYASKTDPSTGYTAGQDVDEFSFVGWFYGAKSDTITSAGWQILWQWADTANRGIRLVARRWLIYERSFLQVGIQFGDGGSFYVPDNDMFVTLTSHYGSTAYFPGRWVHVGFTLTVYQDNPKRWRLRLFIDGQIKEAENESKTFKAPATSGGTGQFRFYGDAGRPGLMFDEWKMYARRLEDGEVTADWNSGTGLSGTGAEQGLVSGWHFDTNGNSYGPKTNNLTLGGGAAITSNDAGIVPVVPIGNTTKAARYKIEVVRNCLDSTHERVSDDASWVGVTTYENEALSYPGCALLGISVPSSEQLEGPVPEVTAVVNGRLLPTWYGSEPSYVFSNNPAWVALDIIINTDYGLGDHYTIDDCDQSSFIEWADWCRSLLYDLRWAAPLIEGVISTVRCVRDVQYLSSYSGSTYSGPALGIQMPREAWRLMGNLDVDDWVGFVNVPTVSGGPWPSINCEDGPPGYNTGPVNPAVIGGLQVVEVAQVNNERMVWVKWEHGSAPWPDTHWLSEYVVLNGDAHMQRRVRQAEFNGVADTNRNAWDVLLDVCAVGRAIPVRVGKRIRIKYDAPRTPVDLVSFASVVPGSFEMEFGGGEQRPNVLELEILDRDANWDRAFPRVEHPSVQDTATFQGYRVESQFLWGVTGRAQARRFGLYQLNIMHLVTRRGRFRMGPEALPYEPGDVVVLGHDLVYGSTSGRIDGPGTGNNTVVLDRDVVLVDGSTKWAITCRSAATGSMETNYVDQTTHVPPITIAAGVEITCSNVWTREPTKNDPWHYCREEYSGERDRLLAQIVNVRLLPSLEVDVEWMEYNEAVYDDSALYPEESADFEDGPAPDGRSVPDMATNVKASIRATGDSSGESRVLVEWTHASATIRSVSGTRVYMRDADSAGRGDWRLMATASGVKESAEFVFAGTRGSSYQIKAQPINGRGVGYGLKMLPTCELVAYPTEVVPSAPAGLSVSMDGDKATYSVLLDGDEASRGQLVSIRRGGWVLGQRVAVLPPGATHFGPTRDWAGGSGGATLYARKRTRRGLYGQVLSLVFDGEAPGTLPLQQFTNSDRSWGPTWTGAGEGAVVELSVETDLEGNSYLGFGASGALTGYYTTSLGFVLQRARTRLCYVDVWWDAWQDSAEPFDEMFGLGLLSSAWSFEGRLDDQAASCTIVCEIQLDGVGDWIPFQPGLYRIKTAKFRLVVTRPSLAYDVRIYQFHTRVVRQEFDRSNSNKVSALLEAEVLNG